MLSEDSSTDSEEQETMVITLGSRMIKAGYSGEKTCRYVSEEVHISNTDDPTLIKPEEGSVPLLDIPGEKTNNKTALKTALRRCWSEQYSPKLDPKETRLALVIATRSHVLLTEIAELVFTNLHVQELCLMTPGEGVIVIEGEENCVVVDIGYRDTRIETFVNWRMVERVVVRVGGYHLKTVSGHLETVSGHLEMVSGDARELLLSTDSSGVSIPGEVQKVLRRYEKICRVVVVGSTSFRLDKDFIGVKCGVSHGSRCVKYSLPPERNKSAWLGASIAADLSYSQHRFYSAADWRERWEVIEPIIDKK